MRSAPAIQPKRSSTRQRSAAAKSRTAPPKSSASLRSRGRSEMPTETAKTWVRCWLGAAALRRRRARPSRHGRIQGTADSPEPKQRVLANPRGRFAAKNHRQLKNHRYTQSRRSPPALPPRISCAATRGASCPLDPLPAVQGWSALSRPGPPVKNGPGLSSLRLVAPPACLVGGAARTMRRSCERNLRPPSPPARRRLAGPPTRRRWRSLRRPAHVERDAIRRGPGGPVGGSSRPRLVRGCGQSSASGTCPRPAPASGMLRARASPPDGPRGKPAARFRPRRRRPRALRTAATKIVRRAAGTGLLRGQTMERGSSSGTAAPDPAWGLPPQTPQPRKATTPANRKPAYARPEKSRADLRSGNAASSIHVVAWQSRALGPLLCDIEDSGSGPRVACGPLRCAPPLTAMRGGTMKTPRSSPSCGGCSQPVARLHLTLTCSPIEPGVCRRWRFCSLLCLQAWCATQRALTPPS